MGEAEVKTFEVSTAEINSKRKIKLVPNQVMKKTRRRGTDDSPGLKTILKKYTRVRDMSPICYGRLK